MPFGGNDWLALTQERSLEPDLPICDPHHHFWDYRPARLPYQRYLLDELLADIGAGHNVCSTVFIETRSMYRTQGPEELRPVGEIEFVQGLAAASASGIYGPSRAAGGRAGNLHSSRGSRNVLAAIDAAADLLCQGAQPGPAIFVGEGLEPGLAEFHADRVRAYFLDHLFDIRDALCGHMGGSHEVVFFFVLFKECHRFRQWHAGA